LDAGRWTLDNPPAASADILLRLQLRRMKLVTKMTFAYYLRTHPVANYAAGLNTHDWIMSPLQGFNEYLILFLS